ncbi:hypothetical protein WM46_02405 [Citrobacter freundii complex sp. CFNIH2]|nr:hypothetical protein WM46_02405 [Citrobacter freundii complex sp. CFNIH2]
MFRKRRREGLHRRVLDDEASLRDAEVKVTHSAMNYLYYGEFANTFRFNTTRSHAWKCSKSTAVLKAGSNAGVTTPPR